MSPRGIAKALAGVGISALLVVALMTLRAVYRRSSAAGLQRVAGMVPGSLLHAHNFHWTEMKGSQKEWVLTASDASYSADRKSISLVDARLTTVAQDGHETSVIAPKALIKVDGNTMQSADMTGGIIVHYGEFVLATENATFDPQNDRIAAPGEVTVLGRGLKVTGIGLTGSPKRQVFTLGERVTTHIVPGDRAPVSGQPVHRF